MTLEFKIEPDSARKRDAGLRFGLWGAVLFFIAIFTSTFVLRSRGVQATSLLLAVCVCSLIAAILLAFFIAAREGLNRAEREMVFVVDGTKIARRRPGYPDEEIAFRDIKSIGRELSWLIIRSTERKIAIPDKVDGFKMLCSEISKHYPLTVHDTQRRRARELLATSVAALPYLTGASLIFVTTDLVTLAIAGGFITLLCTSGAYALRRRNDRETAAHRLMVDPLLYGFEFFLSAVLAHYMFAARV